MSRISPYTISTSPNGQSASAIADLRARVARLERGGGSGGGGGGGGPPSGGAGGHLTGTYPNPTILTTAEPQIAGLGVGLASDALGQVRILFDSAQPLVYSEGTQTAIGVDFKPVKVVNHYAATTGDPFAVQYYGVSSELLYGAGATANTTLGTGHALTSQVIVTDSGSNNNEFTSLRGMLRWDTSTATPGRGWLCDWTGQGPTTQPGLFAGHTALMQNRYNGVPVNAPSFAYAAATRSQVLADTTTTYPMDVGFLVVGTSGTSGNAGVGFTTGFKAGGFGTGWMSSGSSHLTNAFWAQDYVSFGLKITNRHSTATTARAISLGWDGSGAASTSVQDGISFGGDIDLYRSFTTRLNTGAEFVVGAYPNTTNAGWVSFGATTPGLMDSARSNAASSMWRTYVSGVGDSTHRFVQTADGTHSWGPGTGAVDTSLYRGGIGQAQLDYRLGIGINAPTGTTVNAAQLHAYGQTGERGAIFVSADASNDAAIMFRNYDEASTNRWLMGRQATTNSFYIRKNVASTGVAAQTLFSIDDATGRAQIGGGSRVLDWAGGVSACQPLVVLNASTAGGTNADRVGGDAITSDAVSGAADSYYYGTATQMVHDHKGSMNAVVGQTILKPYSAGGDAYAEGWGALAYSDCYRRGALAGGIEARVIVHNSSEASPATANTGPARAAAGVFIIDERNSETYDNATYFGGANAYSNWQRTGARAVQIYSSGTVNAGTGIFISSNAAVGWNRAMVYHDSIAMGVTGASYNASTAITAVTVHATAPQVTSTAHGLLVGYRVTIAGVTGTGTLPANINSSFVVATVVDANNFTVSANTSGGTYTSGGTAQREILITTGVAHNIQTGDRVTLTDVGGNTNANTKALATYASTTTFWMNGVVGNATYTSLGNVAKGRDLFVLKGGDTAGAVPTLGLNLQAAPAGGTGPPAGAQGMFFDGAGAIHVVRNATTGAALNLWSAGEAQPRIRFRFNASTGLEMGPGGSTTPDTNLYRTGTSALRTDSAMTVAGTFGALGTSVFTGSTTHGSAAFFTNTAGSGYIQVVEQSAQPAAVSNAVQLFAEDNGSGKTRLMARFATGAVQQVAIEP